MTKKSKLLELVNLINSYGYTIDLETLEFQISRMEKLGYIISIMSDDYLLKMSKEGESVFLLDWHHKLYEFHTLIGEYTDEDGVITDISVSVEKFLTEETFEALTHSNDDVELEYEEDEDDGLFYRPTFFEVRDLEKSDNKPRDEFFNILCSYGISYEDVYVYELNGEGIRFIYDGTPLVPIFDYDFDDGRVYNNWGIAETDSLMAEIDAMAKRYGYSHFELDNSVSGRFVK